MTEDAVRWISDFQIKSKPDPMTDSTKWTWYYVINSATILIAYGVA